MDRVPTGTEALEGVGGESLPLSATFCVGERLAAAAVVLYAPEGDADGHFVIFDLEDAKTQYTEFLATAVTDDLPTIPNP